MDGALLNCVTRWGVRISEMKLPVFYHDNSKINVIYSASTKLVKQLLPDHRMHPLEIRQGRCLVAFTAFEYRMTDIGLYNKFSIGIMISYGRKRRPSQSIFTSVQSGACDKYILYLPVTTESARIGGIETYGYPKMLADISFKSSSGFTECNVSENKDIIVNLRVPELHTSPGGNVSYRTFAVRNGMILCSNIYSKYNKYAESWKPRDVKLSIGNDHAICSKLRLMDIDDRAEMYQYIPSCESLLSIPRDALEN